MINSFKYAFEGIRTALKERSFRIMCLVALSVVGLGVLLTITLFEWLILILTIVLVLSLELINSQVERTLDIVCPEIDPRVKAIKDISAGAVLIASIGSVFIGVMIFYHHIAS